MSLKKYALQQTSFLHLKDGNDALMYVDDAEGKPDKSKPRRVELYGPGSKIYATTQALAGNRAIERLKKKKSDQSADERIAERAEFLSSCTKSMENMEYDGLVGNEMYKAIYSDLELCFIPQQIDAYLGDTSNFTKPSTTN